MMPGAAGQRVPLGPSARFWVFYSTGAASSLMLCFVPVVLHTVSAA